MKLVKFALAAAALAATVGLAGAQQNPPQPDTRDAGGGGGQTYTVPQLVGNGLQVVGATSGGHPFQTILILQGRDRVFRCFVEPNPRDRVLSSQCREIN